VYQGPSDLRHQAHRIVNISVCPSYRSQSSGKVLAESGNRRKTASSNLAKAEYAMSYFTEVGVGTLTNLEEAKRWCWRAAYELRENAPIYNEFDS
jgi:hypothetical protein